MGSIYGATKEKKTGGSIYETEEPKTIYATPVPLGEYIEPEKPPGLTGTLFQRQFGLPEPFERYMREQPETIREQEALEQYYKTHPERKPRKYESFIGELLRNTGGGTLNVASGLTGTLASVSEGAIWDKEQVDNLAWKLHRKAKEPAFTPAEGGGWKGFVAASVGQAAPYMGAAVGATLLTGTPMGAFGVGYAVEGDNAYRDAIAAGASEEDAQMNRFIVGTINASIEALQVSQVMKFAKVGKGSAKGIVKAASDRAWKKVLAKGGKVGYEAAKHSAREALEEVLQETTQIVAISKHNPKVWDTATQRILMSGLGGGTVGLLLGGGGRVMTNMRAKAEAGKLTPQQLEVMNRTKAEYDAIVAKGGIGSNQKAKEVIRKGQGKLATLEGEEAATAFEAEVAEMDAELREIQRPATESTPAVKPLPPERISPPEAEIAHPGEAVEAEKRRKPLKTQEVIAKKEKYTPAKPPTVAAGATKIEQFGIKALQKTDSLKGITDEEALNILRAKDIDAQEEAVKQILRNRGIDVDKIDIPPYEIRGALTGAEEARPTIKGRKPSHQEAINLAVDEAMRDVTNVIDVQMPYYEPAPPTPAKPPAKPAEVAKEKMVTVYRGITGKEGDRFLVTRDRSVAESHSKIVESAQVPLSSLKSGDEELGFYAEEVPPEKVGEIEAWISKKDFEATAPAPEKPPTVAAEVEEKPISSQHKQDILNEFEQDRATLMFESTCVDCEGGAEFVDAQMDKTQKLAKNSLPVKELIKQEYVEKRWLKDWEFYINDNYVIGVHSAIEHFFKIESPYLESITEEHLAAKPPVEKAAEPELTKKELRQRELKAETEEFGISPRRRNRLLKETAKRIAESDIYQSELEGLEDMGAEIGPGYYYVPQKFRSEVEDVIGKRKGGLTRLQKMFTFDPYAKKIVDTPEGKREIGPLPWDTAVQQALGRGKVGLAETAGEMDIAEFAQRVKDSVDAEEEVGGLNKQALERAYKSGDPYLQYLMTKQDMLHSGKTVTEIDEMTREWAEYHGLDESEIENEFLGPEPLKIKEIRALPEAKQDEAVEALARENVLKQERQEAKQAVNDVLKANDLEVEVEEVAEIEEGEEIPFERRGQPTGAAIITPAGREIVQLAYGADSETGYHEAYHTLRRHLTPKDRKVLDMRFKGDQEAEAREFAEFAKTGKAKTGYLRGIWRKLVEKLRKIKSALQGRGYRTANDIFGEIQRGVVPKEGAAPGAVQFERGVFGQPIHEQLRLPLPERQAAIKKVAVQEAREKIAKRKAKPAKEALPEGVKDKGQWKLTLDEYVAKYGKKGQDIGVQRAFFGLNHRKWVQWALKQGKPVPRKVLEEYKSEKWAQEALRKPYEEWRPKGVVSIKTKLIKAVDQVIATNTKRNVVQITPEEIVDKLRKQATQLFREDATDKERAKIPDLFYNPHEPLSEVTEAFNQLVKGGPLIQFETQGDQWVRESMRKARIKAEKERLKAKVAPKARRTKLKIKIRDVTPQLSRELGQEPGAMPKRKPDRTKFKADIAATPKFAKEFDPDITLDELVAEPRDVKPKQKIYLTDKWFQENIKPHRKKAAKKPTSMASRSFKMLDKTLGSSSTRLYNIHPELFRQTRRFAADTMMRSTDMIAEVEPFLKAMKKMSKDDYKMFDLALKNGYERKIAELVGKYGLEKEYSVVRDVLDDLYNAAKEVGIDMEYRKEYWHRHLKDPEGFLEYFQKGDDWSIIEEAIKRRAERAGRTIEELTDEEKAQVVNTLLRGYRIEALTLARPGAAKARTVEVIDADLNQFYDDSATAMVKYIRLMNRKIAEREFFGRETKEITDLRKLQSSRLTRLLKLQRRRGLKEGTAEGKYKEHISKTAENWKAGQERLQRLANASPENTIGGYVMDLQRTGQIKPTQEKELRDILQGIFYPRGMGRGMGLFATGVYIDTLNSPLQALTQLDEFAYSFYRSPTKSVPVAIRTALRKSKITPRDIGITSIGQEFQGPSMQRALSLMLKSTGFEQIDRLNKENYINTALAKMQAQAKGKASPALIKRLVRVFGKDYKNVLEDLRKPIRSMDDVSDDVKYLLFNQLLDIQPVAITEMPEAYNKAGNMRILYALKTFYMKRVDFIRNEIWQDMKSPKTFARGFGKLVWLAFSFALMGAGSDALKDFIKGRKFDLGDSVWDNLLKIVFFSKYQLYKTKTEGGGRAALETWIPPTKAIDAVSKDVVNVAKGKDRGFEIWRSIPWVGELYYWWFGRGREKIEAKEGKGWSEATE